jgi:predicted Zn finger-like uncharacterized protein
MQTRCPNCETRYEVDPEALARAHGQAQCYRCGCLFDGIAQRPIEPQTTAPPLMLDLQVEPDHAEPVSAPDGTDDLPFAVPDDLEPLEPSPEAALDVTDTLYEKRSIRGPLYATLALLLAVGLGAQLAWQQRVALLERFPQLAPLCDRLECIERQVHAPEQLRVLERELRPADNQPGILNLSARFRNDADAAQPLPDIQLSLLDNNGSTLIRRRLSPGDYLYPPPSPERLIAPGEVITISIDFKDPGYLATGFMIDFL